MIALLIAGTIGFLTSLIGTRFLIGFLTRKKAEQPIHETVKQHSHKKGTPTMGGIAIVVATVLAYLVTHLREGVIFTHTGMLTMGAIVGAGFVGFLDDYIKIRNARNLGLSKRTKSFGLLVIGILYAFGMLAFTSVHTNLGFTRFDVPGIRLGVIGWFVVAVLVIQAVSNAVNITDGLDGLAAGSSGLSFAAYTMMAFVAFRHFSIYRINHALDLAVIAASLLGACIGFLWWNAAPARIIMGDVGALAIGTGLACLALGTNTTLLLPIIGGLYMMETTSVLIQMTSYRYFGKRRVFRMTPIHHHFELKDWPETTIIIRFWIIAAILTALALGIFYADFVSTGGIE